MAIIDLAVFRSTVGQRGFWDDQQRVAKLQEKKPVLSKPSGGGTGKSRTKPLNHQLGDVRLKVLSMS